MVSSKIISLVSVRMKAGLCGKWSQIKRWSTIIQASNTAGIHKDMSAPLRVEDCTGVSEAPELLEDS
jgi:arginine/ornithine N-succinyltransferase beta subunit